MYEEGVGGVLVGGEYVGDDGVFAGVGGLVDDVLEEGVFVEVEPAVLRVGGFEGEAE